MIATYEQEYHCNDEKLLRIYLWILTSIHIVMGINEVIIVWMSARGTMANPEPRRYVYVLLYIEAALFVFKFAWDIVGVLWAYDPSIDCHRSHPFLVLCRLVLIWNLFLTTVIGCYGIIRIGLCNIPCFGPRINNRKLVAALKEEGIGLRELSSGEIRHQKRRDIVWKWRLKWLLCWMKLEKKQRTAYKEVAIVMTDAFTHLRGYVPSDVAAGIALTAMDQSLSKVAHTVFN